MSHPDATTGRVGSPAPTWADALSATRQRISTMSPHSQIWVRIAAAIIRWLVLRFPGFSGAIACALVFIEIETAVSRGLSVSHETAARSTC